MKMNDNVSAKVCSKDILTQICKLLEVDCSVLKRLPKNGFTKDNLISDRSCRSANFIANKLMNAILSKVSPSNEDFVTSWKIFDSPKTVQPEERVDTNLAKLVLIGDAPTWVRI